MDFGVLVTSVLSSTVLAGIVSAFVSKSKADKEHSIKNVTQERKVWRDEMRAATLAVRELYEREKRIKNPCCKLLSNIFRKACNIPHSSRADEGLFLHFNFYGEAEAYLRVRLNPSDCEDQKILDCFGELKSKEGFPIDKFERLMASMLKYEWEKAKREIKSHSLFSAFSVSAIVCFFLYIFDEYIAIPVIKLFGKMDTGSCVNIGNSGNGNVFYIGKAEYVSICQNLLDLLFIGFFFASCVFATYAFISLFTKALSRSFDENLGFTSRHDTLKATFAYCFEIPYRVPDKEPQQAQGAASLAWLMTACIIVMAFAYIMSLIILFFLFLGLFTFLFSFSNYLV